MGLFFGRKKTQRAERRTDLGYSDEIERIKKETDETTDFAHKKAQELHAVLLANNISIQVERATRSQSGN